MRISDWSSDVCSSDLLVHREAEPGREDRPQRRGHEGAGGLHALVEPGQRAGARHALTPARSEAQRADRGRGGRTMVERAAELRPEDLDELVRSEEHTSELQSLMRSSYAVFCLKKQKQIRIKYKHSTTQSTTY